MNADEIVRALRECGDCDTCPYYDCWIDEHTGDPADACDEGRLFRDVIALIESLTAQLAERDKELKRLQKEVASLAIESIEREKTLAKLEAEVMQLWEAQRWTDAEYDTPDIGQAVLLYMPDKETDNIRAGEYLGEGDYRIGNKLYRGMEIDAWLPLPAAPEEGKQI